ncbi:MAG: hypothetical protein JXA87_01190 [Thermoleophilia bacterium]|nr:hypothetical protein [Thermoleophilia bacterium]
MVFPDDALPAQSCCEICGVELGDEIVIQEFADGSLARLCPECAAGAALEERHHSEPRPSDSSPAGKRSNKPGPGRRSDSPWPDEREAPVVQAADSDPLERTRELLMPVGDLIALQTEMQGALERLAGSLERFAAEYITEAQGKTAAESRLRMLEHELDMTRARLQEAEFSLTGAVAAVSASSQLLDVTAAPLPEETEPIWSPAGSDAPLSDPVWSPLEEAPVDSVAPSPMAAPASSAESEPTEMLDSPELSSLSIPASLDFPDDAPAAEPVMTPADTVPAPAVTREGEDSSVFRIEEVQSAQRYYNESPFTGRIRDVHRSLGKPKANLTKVPGGEPRAIVTIAWDIVWYQYLVYLRRDLPGSHERVVLHREGMDLDELAYYFKEKNAVVNDDGRLDASELEVRLLSDPDALITEMTAEEKRLLEDATEEIWDHRIAPEFKWDD